MKKVIAFIERSGKGDYSVYIKDTEALNYGIHGTGSTAKGAIEDFESAYEAMKQFHAHQKKEFIEAQFEFQYDVASFLEFYSTFMSLAGLSRLTGVSQGQLSHYLTGHRRPSKATVEKIESSIHQFSKELSEVKFV